MGKRLANLSDEMLERSTRDARLSETAKRAARAELSRRGRLDDHCPKGQACNSWTCEKAH